MSRADRSREIGEFRAWHLRQIDMQKLTERVVETGSDPNKLKPLLLYRGGINFARIQALYNFFHMMTMAEVSSWEDMRLLSVNHHDGAHLCGLHAKSGVAASSMYGFLGRLEQHKNALLGPHEREFLDWFIQDKRIVALEPISELANINFKGAGSAGALWWRKRAKICRSCAQMLPLDQFPSGRIATNRPPRPGARKNLSRYCRACWEKIFSRAQERVKQRIAQRQEPKPYEQAYPFRAKGVVATHDLLERVHELVPKSLPREIRGDVCQDLIVAVLAGDISAENLADRVPEYVKRVFKMFPIKYGHLSLDQIIPGTDGLTLLETLHA